MSLPPGPVVVDSVSKRFDDLSVLDGLSLELEPGSFTALLGHSGSGKSTLLRILAGLDADFDGSVQIPGTVAVAFQEPRLLPWARVAANVVLGVGSPDATARGRVALEEVGLADKARAWPLTLSGGQAQRASLARALVREPELLLLDEPFGALDALTRRSMHQLVLDLWHRHSPTVLIVTHDVEEALRLADRVVVLDRGEIAWDARVPEPRGLRLEKESVLRLRRELYGALGVDMVAA
jgi:sulfonate transport system ATP-binding protein